jgi:hypothetical protein
MDELRFEDLKLEVSPSSGSQIRRVLALWRGDYCHVDTLNVWRASDRERFFKALAAKTGQNDQALRDYIDRKLIALAHAADEAAAKMAQQEAPALQGRPVQIDPPEPWPTAVTLAETLDANVALIRRHIYTTDEAARAAALWACATHAIDLLDSIGYLRITSPDRSCGKSTFARLLKESLRKPLYVANVTPASLFRLIESVTPSLILDECDNLLKTNPELLSMLNAGITRREAVIYRCVGDDSEVRAFSVFGPKLICGIGQIAGPLASRCITILMHRKPKDVRLPRLNQGLVEAANIGRKYARWMLDHAGKINFDADPPAPDELSDRQCDCWRPLFLLADAAGGDWPQAARRAAVVLSGGCDAEDNLNIRLLLDIARLLGHKAEVSASEIAKTLNDDPNLEWGRFGGRGISPVTVGRRLKQLGIRPRGSKNVNLYAMDAIRELATRYTPDTSSASSANDVSACQSTTYDSGRSTAGGRSAEESSAYLTPCQSTTYDDGGRCGRSYGEVNEDDAGVEYF